jgi:hypothetical protein
MQLLHEAEQDNSRRSTRQCNEAAKRWGTGEHLPSVVANGGLYFLWIDLPTVSSGKHDPRHTATSVQRALAADSDTSGGQHAVIVLGIHVM